MQPMSPWSSFAVASFFIAKEGATLVEYKSFCENRKKLKNHNDYGKYFKGERRLTFTTDKDEKEKLLWKVCDLSSVAFTTTPFSYEVKEKEAERLLKPRQRYRSFDEIRPNPFEIRREIRKTQVRYSDFALILNACSSPELVTIMVQREEMDCTDEDIFEPCDTGRIEIKIDPLTGAAIKEIMTYDEKGKEQSIFFFDCLERQYLWDYFLDFRDSG